MPPLRHCPSHSRSQWRDWGCSFNGRAQDGQGRPFCSMCLHTQRGLARQSPLRRGFLLAIDQFLTHSRLGSLCPRSDTARAAHAYARETSSHLAGRKFAFIIAVDWIKNHADSWTRTSLRSPSSLMGPPASRTNLLLPSTTLWRRPPWLHASASADTLISHGRPTRLSSSSSTLV